MKILIDNGHGVTTPGKCSPDRSLLEWKWNREIAQRLSRMLTLKGVDCSLIVPEDADPSLTERVRRVNAWCDKLGSKNCALISIHVNAAGADSKWHDAKGWCGFIAPTASDNSKRLAQLLYAEAEKRGLKGNRCVPKEKYWVDKLTMVTRTKCPAVLTENLFQDNREDVKYLLSEEGKQAIAELHCEAILKYIGR